MDAVTRWLARSVEGAERADLEDAYRGTLLGLAVGNALGCQVEGWSATDIAEKFQGGVTEVPEWERHAPLDDDVAQSVILAEALLERGRLDYEDLAHRFVTWARENGRGIGNLTARVIGELERGVPAPDAARVVWDLDGRAPAGNGAVKRCAPVALRWRAHPERLVGDAQRSALVTHFDPRCVWSTVVTVGALAVHLSGESVDTRGLGRSLGEDGAPEEVLAAVGGVEGSELDDFELDDANAMGYTLKAMQAALWSAGQDDPESVLSAVVGAGGDTDTNAAVAGAFIGARAGASHLPEGWVSKLGHRDLLVDLADRLRGAAS